MMALAVRGTILAARKRTPAAIAYAEATKRPAKVKRPSAPPVAASWPIVDAVRLALPLPPSVNAHTFNAPGRGRIKTEAYRQWIDAAGWIVVREKPGRIVGPYTLTLHLPDAMRGDLDNRLKAAADLFVRLGVTADDRHCRRAIAEKSHAIPKGECFVVLRAVNP